MDKKDLVSMTVVELRALAARLHVPLNKRMKKAEIIDVLADGPHKKPAGSSSQPSRQSGAETGVSVIPEDGMKQSMEESKFYTGPAPEPSAATPAELPHQYNDDRITLITRDPYWAYAYWEVTPKKIEAEKAALGSAGQGASLALRLYDVTNIMFNGFNAHGYYDIGIYERVGNWYMDLGRPGRSFVADLGLKTHDGRFVTLARSNAISAPSDGVSDILDEEWVLPERDFERLFALSGGYGIGLSSAELRLAAAQRIPFGIASPGIGSLALMSPIKKRERGFWFVLNTELVVYGATEPDARVTVQGTPVSLRPDGTFTLRFALPDGTQVIPVSATSQDHVETRWITPTVNRQTNY